MVRTLEKYLKKTGLKLSDHYKIKKSIQKGYNWFRSDCGETYICHFIQNKSDLTIHGMETMKPVYTIFISRRFKVFKPKMDNRVSYTISVLVNNFFIKNPEAVICFICDDSDLRAKYRHKTFEKWFKQSNLNPRKHFVNASISNSIYFGTIMLYTNSEREKFNDYLNGEFNDFKNKETTINSFNI